MGTGSLEDKLLISQNKVLAVHVTKACVVVHVTKACVVVHVTKACDLSQLQYQHQSMIKSAIPSVTCQERER